MTTVQTRVVGTGRGRAETAMLRSGRNSHDDHVTRSGTAGQEFGSMQFEKNRAGLPVRNRTPAEPPSARGTA